MRFPTLTRISGALKHTMAYHSFASKLLDRTWGLSTPDSRINQIMILNGKEGRMGDDISFRNINHPCLDEGVIKPFPSFFVVRDDLLHPLVNGNKARKLDALLPILEDNAVTDVVTCGGCQSAHTAAVAVSCSERGLKSHLLLRGEEPETLTGYNLISSLYGNVVYVPRSVYANREEMLSIHAESVAGSKGSVVKLSDMMESSCKNYELEHRKFPKESRKVVIINEGAGNAVALLGVMRLIQYMSRGHVFGNKQALKMIVDAGTGTTAVGLGLGALCLGLPWEVTAIMLADKIDAYKEKEKFLISEFFKMSWSSTAGLNLSNQHSEIVQWVERRKPRKFGNILKGEVEECKKIAQQTGILVDPIYTLAAWDAASRLCKNEGKDTKVVMLHTGGTLGMFGLAQRYKSHFRAN